jgi:hypothetical protein
MPAAVAPLVNNRPAVFGSRSILFVRSETIRSGSDDDRALANLDDNAGYERSESWRMP